MPVASFSASAGTVRKPSESVPQTPAMPCAASAPTGSSIPIRSTRRTPKTTITPATEADHDRGPGGDERARCGDRDERRDRAVQHHREVGLLDHEPRGDDCAEHAGRGREVRVQRDVGEEADAAEVDAERRARVEAEPAEPEDDHAERRERHVVARDRVRLPVVRELADPRPEQQRSGEAGERALVVDDGRAGEVLHAPSRTASRPGSRSSARRTSRSACTRRRRRSRPRAASVRPSRPRRSRARRRRRRPRTGSPRPQGSPRTS